MPFLKIVIEDRLEPLRGERTASERASPSAFEITYDGWCSCSTFDQNVQSRATRLDVGWQQNRVYDACRDTPDEAVGNKLLWLSLTRQRVVQRLRDDFLRPDIL